MSIGKKVKTLVYNDKVGIVDFGITSSIDKISIIEGEIEEIKKVIEHMQEKQKLRKIIIKVR